MDEDQFNDFEQGKQVATQLPQQIKSQQTYLSNPVLATQQLTFPSFEQISINTSSALGTQSPSSQVTDPEDKVWDISVEPNLAKFVSGHQGATGSMLTEFVKTSSQGEIKIDFPVKMDDLLFSKGGNQADKSTLQFFNGGFGVQDESKTNFLNPSFDFNNSTSVVASNTIKKQQNEEFGFGLTYKEQKKPNMKQQSYFQHIQVQQKPQFVQNSNGLMNFASEIIEQQPRKQSDQFVFGQHVQNTEQLSTNVQSTGLSNIPTFQKTSESVEFPLQIISFSTDKKDINPILNNPIDTSISNENEVQKKLPEKQILSQQPTLQVQEDDQFGQFQETAPVSEQQVVKQINGVSEANIVKIQQQKIPYGVDANKRQQELQQLVNSLPDYSFLFIEAFNSL